MNDYNIYLVGTGRFGDFCSFTETEYFTTDYDEAIKKYLAWQKSLAKQTLKFDHYVRIESMPFTQEELEYVTAGIYDHISKQQLLHDAFNCEVSTELLEAKIYSNI